MVLQTRGSRVAFYYFGSVAVGVVVMLALRRFGGDLGPIAVAGVSTALIVTANLAFLGYWRALDEVAREAHRYAVFWGTLAAIGVVAVAVITLRLHPEIFPAVDAPPGTIFAFGMLAPLVLLTVAILAGWCFWWLRRLA
jgi:hypothetical protein